MSASFCFLFTLSSRQEFSHLNCCSTELCKTRGQSLDCVSIQLHREGARAGGPAVISVKDEDGGRKRPRWEPAGVKSGVRNGDVNNSLL